LLLNLQTPWIQYTPKTGRHDVPMDNKVSRCYKTFDKKHNLEKIDIKSSSESIKISKNKGINRDYSRFSSFLGDMHTVTSSFPSIFTVQTSLSPHSRFRNCITSLGTIVLVDFPFVSDLPSLLSYFISISTPMCFHVFSLYFFMYINIHDYMNQIMPNIFI